MRSINLAKISCYFQSTLNFLLFPISAEQGPIMLLVQKAFIERYRTDTNHSTKKKL